MRAIFYSGCHIVVERTRTIVVEKDGEEPRPILCRLRACVVRSHTHTHSVLYSQRGYCINTRVVLVEKGREIRKQMTTTTTTTILRVAGYTRCNVPPAPIDIIHWGKQQITDDDVCGINRTFFRFSLLPRDAAPPHQSVGAITFLFTRLIDTSV